MSSTQSRLASPGFDLDHGKLIMAKNDGQRATRLERAGPPGPFLGSRFPLL
jgi:hypothetical protein